MLSFLTDCWTAHSLERCGTGEFLGGFMGGGCLSCTWGLPSSYEMLLIWLSDVQVAYANMEFL